VPIPAFCQCHAQEVKRIHGKLDEERLRCETIRRIINSLVIDLTKTSRQNIDETEIASIEDVRHTEKPLICFSPTMQKNFARTEGLFAKTSLSSS